MLRKQNTRITNEVAAEDMNPATNDDRRTDVLIIGAGLAGLSTAMSLPKSLQVIVLAKEGLDDCSSNYAQGGIAAVIDDNDSVTDHVKDTLIAGDGLCDQVATTHILSQGSQAIEWLLEQDVPFTKHPTDNSVTAIPSAKTRHTQNTPHKLDALHLTQEGGHGCRRVVHADDATGRHVMHTLHKQIIDSPNITVLPYHDALTLLVKDNPHAEAYCHGARVFDLISNTYLTINSSTVVLASGGLGQLFSRASAPDVCVGDGIMMAWEAGCRLANLEFIQFHPTGLAFKDSNFLISEAVRGEGGRLICPITQQRFMPNYDERAELAPRDIVARAIANEIAKNGLGYVNLDISHQPADFIKSHFPDIYAHCFNLGIDITVDPIPVAPTAHYTCGGVMTTTGGHTDLRGLYAAGEVAHTGLHGANRLASNSLLECVVVGREVAAHISDYINQPVDSVNDWPKPYLPHSVMPALNQTSLSRLTSFNVPLLTMPIFNAPFDAPIFNASITGIDRVKADKTPLYQTLTGVQRRNAQKLANSGHLLSDLKQLMTDNMGISRTHTNLCHALHQVTLWQQQLSIEFPSLSAAPSLPAHHIAADQVQVFKQHRLLRLASLLLHSAIAREESRGGHYRHDYPTTQPNPAISIINTIQKDPSLAIKARADKESVTFASCMPASAMT